MQKEGKKYLTLFHTYLFIFGAIYYWILPPFLLQKNILTGLPGIHLIEKYNFNLYSEKYYIIVISFILSFILGSICPLRFKRKRTALHKKDVLVSSKDLFLLSLPIISIGQFAIFKARHSLFSGYSEEYNVEILGTIATSICIILFFYLFIKQQAYKKDFSSQNKHKKFSKIFLFFLIEFSIVILGFGSRMYVIIPVTSYFIFYLSYHPLNNRIILFASSAIIIFVGIGVWRVSASMDVSQLIYIGGAEPLFTWISALSYIEYNEISLFNEPKAYLSSFINFIPTVFFPEKNEYIYRGSDLYDSPLGATSFITSLLANFGFIGSCIFLFFGGLLLTYIRYNCRNTFWRVYYYCICGIIPFQIFRDGFYIVNKMIFFNFLFMPYILISILKFLKKSVYLMNTSKL